MFSLQTVTFCRKNFCNLLYNPIRGLLCLLSYSQHKHPLINLMVR